MLDPDRTLVQLVDVTGVQVAVPLAQFDHVHVVIDLSLFKCLTVVETGSLPAIEGVDGSRLVVVVLRSRRRDVIDTD